MEIDKTRPPEGFEVARASKFDPLFGDRRRWAYRGQVGTKSAFGSGMLTRSRAIEAAWEACE